MWCDIGGTHLRSIPAQLNGCLVVWWHASLRFDGCCHSNGENFIIIFGHQFYVFKWKTKEPLDREHSTPDLWRLANWMLQAMACDARVTLVYGRVNAMIFASFVWWQMPCTKGQRTRTQLGRVRNRIPKNKEGKRATICECGQSLTFYYINCSPENSSARCSSLK